MHFNHILFFLALFVVLSFGVSAKQSDGTINRRSPNDYGDYDSYDGYGSKLSKYKILNNCMEK
jgi:hypothetical protein